MFLNFQAYLQCMELCSGSCASCTVGSTASEAQSAFKGCLQVLLSSRIFCEHQQCMRCHRLIFPLHPVLRLLRHRRLQGGVARIPIWRIIHPAPVETAGHCHAPCRILWCHTPLQAHLSPITVSLSVDRWLQAPVSHAGPGTV